MSSRDMRLGIDASNLRAGGGVTHLVEVLRTADPQAHGFSEVVVWGGRSILSHIEDRPWLVKHHEPLLDRSLPFRTFWQRHKLSAAARAAACDVLFVPGGSYAGDFHPIVTMSRNLLPFEWGELRRCGFSWLTAKLLMLRVAQSGTFRRADGVVFLTHYARDAVLAVAGRLRGTSTIIPHGIDPRFRQPPRPQLPASGYSLERPIRVLYVSIVHVYKHHSRVAEAVALLRRQGVPVVLTMIGPAYAPALAQLRRVLRRLDPEGVFLHYRGALPYTALHAQYAQADICVFASSCENMPNILLEGMASGLPMACSNRGPMPEVLGDAGVYFDPEDPAQIARALRELIESAEERACSAQSSFERASGYSWRRCSAETFAFLAARAVAHEESAVRLPPATAGRSS